MSSRTINPWRTSWIPELRGTTGRIFEREVLGECRVTCNGYMRFYQALDAVVYNQPGSTYEPQGETAKLYDAVSNAMRDRGFNPSRLQIYTAVGSALDWFHGIDGFFVFEGAIVTIDVTMNPHKDEAPKARVLIRAEDTFVDYAESAEEIAGWFCRARALNLKGVI